MIRRAWTIRTRIACTYGVLIFGAGGVLLAVTYALLREAMHQQPVNTSIVLTHVSQLQPATPADQAPPREMPPTEQAGWAYDMARSLQADFQRATLDDLAVNGLVALAALSLAGAWLGWFLAGRSLRPIESIAEAARRIGGAGPHVRIPLHGRRDELHELAHTLNDMLSRLTAAMDNQRRFVANASHELKTPLAINRALLENVMAERAAPAQARELAGTLLEVNLRQERLIDGLLTLAQSERADLELVPVDVAKVAAQVIGAAEREARLSDVQVRADLAPSPVLGDPVLLERLVQNLVQNALRHNHPGGQAWVRCRDDGDRVCLTVVNTGPPIPATEVEGLFEPFRRLRERVGADGGSGLGLSIVRSIARAHGGHVSAVPRDGGGLMVTAVLPTGHRPAGASVR